MAAALEPLIVVLIASGAVALVLGEIADGAVVLAVVVANSLIGFVHESGVTGCGAAL